MLVDKSRLTLPVVIELIMIIYIYIYVTEFWKITHMVAHETIRIFEFSMALLISETTFKNISKLYL